MVVDKRNGTPVHNYCRRPPDLPLLKKIRYGIWNPEEKTFLGRTGKRWGIIALIYLATYIFIIVFSSICMCGLLSAMDDRVPYYKLADSIIGDNPGMGHRPLILDEGALIWYNVNNVSQAQKYVDNIEQFLEPYTNKSLLVNGGTNQKDCGTNKPPRREVCSFDVKKLGPCTTENMYGYRNGTPCVIVKLNKIYDWSPDFYEDPGDLPPDMPPDLISHITNTTDPQQRRMVWVSCMGEKNIDTAALGPVKYWPQPGWSEIYFPYDNTPGYLSPLVAVQFLNLKLPAILAPNGISRDDGKRPDGMTLMPWSSGKPLVWDATCVDTMAPSHVQGSSMRAGTAASVAESNKHRKYSSIASRYEFIAFATETMGPWSEDAKQFYNSIAPKLVDVSGDPRAGTYFKQRISLAIQRGNVASVLGTMPQDKLEELYILL